MRIKNNVMIAALAAAALGLSACGGDAGEPTPEPAPTTVAAATEEATSAVEETTPQEETAPVDETTPAEDTTPADDATEESTEEEPVDAPTDFPFEEGPMDVDEFLDRYIPANQAIKTMRAESVTGERPPQVTYMDNTDPANPRAHSTLEMSGNTIETLVEGSTVYTRTNGGAWEEQSLGTDVAEMMNISQNNEMLRQVITSVELANKAERQFNVLLDADAALGGESGGEPMPSTMWVDEQFRLIKQESSAMGMTNTTVYSEFDQPVDIPSVS